MQTAEELQRHINTAADIHDIVRTMKGLAAVSISHHEKAVLSINEYYRTVLLGLQGFMQYGQPTVRRPRRPARRPGTAIIVLFGSDQGMCGAFNDRIVDFCRQQVAELAGPAAGSSLLCVGRRAAMLLEAAGLKPSRLYPVPGTLDGIVATAQQILSTIDRLFGGRAPAEILLLHNRLASGLVYQQERSHLLPLSEQWYDEVTARRWPTAKVPLFTSDQQRLFSALIRQYLFVSLYRAFAESMATENSARLAAMQAAEKNIEERLQGLTMAQRQQRQAVITAELLDIVSGFEALPEPE